MILHNDSTTYWSTGITMRWTPSAETLPRNGRTVTLSGWSGKLDFYDDGFCDNDPDAGQVSTEGRLVTGTLWTRYAVPDGATTSGLSAAIDTLIADATRLGIQFKDPTLYYDADGDSKDWPPPAGWRDLLAAAAARVGWICPYPIVTD